MICLVTCFHGRHSKVERILRCFLNQDYDGPLMLILFNNSRISQILGRIELPSNKYIKLVNNPKDLQTKGEYTNVGDIFRDAMTYVPLDSRVVNFFDSDDIFLPNHVSEGAKGYKEATLMNPERLAYKPHYSYYIHGENQVEKAHNTMEPSIFANSMYVREKGFHPVAASYHQKWEEPLKQNNLIYVKPDGVSTFLYCWESGHNTHKISGLGDYRDNFEAHRRYEVDHGDGILTPCPSEEVETYYNLVNQ